MNISNIFTKSNLRILESIDKEPDHIRDIADKLKISSAKVQQAVNIFRDYNLINEEKKKNRIEISLNRNNILVQKIKSLINEFKIENSNAFKSLQKEGKIGIYGSYNKGNDDMESDVDIFIITKKNELELRPLFRDLEKDIGKHINFMVLNARKIQQLKEKDPEFYSRLKLTSTRGDLIA